MKVFIEAYQPGRIGGGWTFANNFVKGMGGLITGTYDEADIYFITSPSMVQRDQVQKAKQDGKKIVLRIDNAVRNSRNRNTGMSRMKDFAEWADLVIFQSQWAWDYLKPFLYTDFLIDKSIVILNGVDLQEYSFQHHNNSDNILYSRFNRDETKNWEVARYWFSKYQLEHPNAILHIVGQFSPELQDGNFDFYNNEKYKYYGIANKESLATLYSISSLLYTYYNDACSNTLIEALVSGCNIVGDEYYRTTGGSSEILDKFYNQGRDYFSLKRMSYEYIDAINSI